MCVGNRAGLLIQLVGASQISTPSKSLLLKNLLHVPSIEKNLLSVIQFTKDKNACFEFHSHFFCVKDLSSRKILLCRPTKGGLYNLPPSSTIKSTCVGEWATIDTVLVTFPYAWFVVFLLLIIFMYITISFCLFVTHVNRLKAINSPFIYLPLALIIL